jgi:hypothetical protein
MTNTNSSAAIALPSSKAPINAANSTPPLEQYRTAAERYEQQRHTLERLDERIGTLRLLTFVLTIFAAFGWLQFGWWGGMWMLLPITAFVALAIYHGRVADRLARARRALGFYRLGIARLEDAWAGKGSSGERFDDATHVYASDLDLFGRESLFELLSTARTRMGEETLARWLLAPADMTIIRERQRCIEELRQRFTLREDLAVLGSHDRVAVHPELLLKWAQSSTRLTGLWLSIAAWVLPAAALVTAFIWYQWSLISPFLGVLLLEIAVLRAVKEPLKEILNGTENAFDNIKVVAELLARLEQERFVTPELEHLMRSLTSHEARASKVIASLATRAQLIESRRNPLLQSINVPLLYTLHVALAAERWRSQHGAVVHAWLEVIGQMEALVALATFSFERPDNPFPEILDPSTASAPAGGSATFDASALGHPLIPRARCVRNDVAITGATRTLLISGSNMSGKSTLLRAVGINTVLAMAGAPVMARRLTLTPLHVGASIRINDSLHTGSSRFYTEITRLRRLFELSGRQPALLFLLDELLQGTNSRDRRIGATGILQAFIRQGSIGLISTHDLSLTDIDVVADRVRNCHFQDELQDGVMSFDYTLRDGVVTKSNGIELMRSIGLEV